MDTTPEDLEKFRQDILKCLGTDTLPGEAEYLLEYRATEKITKDIWRDLMLLLASSKLRDTSSLSLSQKFILLESLHLYLIRENKPLERQLYKTIRPKLNTSREIFLDLQDILSYKATRKEKYRLSSLRKYGPVKGATFKNKLREQFAASLQKGAYQEALELVFIINYRKIADRKELDKEYLERVEKELLTAAGELQLDLNKLTKSFSADRPQLKSTYTPDEQKVNIIFKPIQKP